MKIIFSRKGYDSATGKIPSPVFEDGTICPLPIPSTNKLTLKDVRFQNTNLDLIVGQLKKGSDLDEFGVHLDPDLNREARPRKTGWLPSFGQVGAAQTHLENRSVGKGDLFLFFGWFRKALTDNGKLRYDKNSQNIHCLFGWLQIGTIYHLDADNQNIPDWAFDHPHVHEIGCYRSSERNNTLYVASPFLSLPGLRHTIAGGGTFLHFKKSLQLTEPGSKRSLWRLPNFFTLLNIYHHYHITGIWRVGTEIIKGCF